MKKTLIVGLAILAVAGGTAYFFLQKQNQDKSPSPIVAQVGPSRLTQADILKRIPQEYSEFITYEQNVDYVKRWIDSEILFQTAKTKKIDEEPAIQKRLEQMGRDLLTSEMISRLSNQNTHIPTPDIEKFYQDNLEDFRRKETEIKFVHMCLKSLGEAWRVRNQVTPHNFLQLAGKLSIDPVEDITKLSWVNRNEVMPELAEVIFDIKIGGATPPIKTAYGFFLVKIIDKKGPNSIRSLPEVKEQIINRIASKSQKVHLEEIISGLRKKMIVKYNIDLIPGKSDNNLDQTRETAEKP